MQIVGALGGLDVLINNASDLGPMPLKLLADTECEDLGTRACDERLRPFSADQGAPWFASCVRAGRSRSSGSERVERRRFECLPSLGSLWREQGSVTSPEPHLGRRTHVTEGVRILSIDPGDMDTPMHAAAVPDADNSTLKPPEVAARELADAVAAVLSRRPIVQRGNCMIAANQPVQRPSNAKVLMADRKGNIEHHVRSELANLLRPGDVVVANDAATLPASLSGQHGRSGRSIEVRLAGRASLDEVRQYSAVVFGEGDFRTRTESRAETANIESWLINWS